MGGDSESKKRGPARVRLRCWVFTVNTDVFDPSPEGPEEESTTPPRRDWDPNGLAFDGDIVRFVCAGLEVCPNTRRLHWQGYIELNKAFGISKVKEVLSCTWCHLEPRRGTQEEAIVYTEKTDSGVLDDDGTKIMFRWGEPAANGVRRTGLKNDHYTEVLSMSTYQEALSKLQELEPADYVRFHASVKSALMSHFMQNTVYIRPVESFNRPLISPDILKSKAVVLHGVSGTGKTAYALAHFKKPFMVSHVDQMKNWNSLIYDGIVFDDMCFSHWPVSTCIHILDLEFQREIHCRFTNGIMPAGFPRIFTTNLSYGSLFNFEHANEEQCNAMLRRMYKIFIDQPLFNKE